jgi:hypothetical protein
MTSTDTVRAAEKTVFDTADEMKAAGREAAGRTKEVGRSLKYALDESIRVRPYTTLIAAGLVGFAYAVLRR